MHATLDSSHARARIMRRNPRVIMIIMSIVLIVIFIVVNLGSRPRRVTVARTGARVGDVCAALGSEWRDGFSRFTDDVTYPTSL